MDEAWQRPKPAPRMRRRNEAGRPKSGHAGTKRRDGLRRFLGGLPRKMDGRRKRTLRSNRQRWDNNPQEKETMEARRATASQAGHREKDV